MKWDKVYAGVGEFDVDMMDDEGNSVMVPVYSFRMVAEIQGRAFQASHVVMKAHMDEFPQQYGYILDEMVEFIDKKYAEVA